MDNHLIPEIFWFWSSLVREECEASSNLFHWLISIKIPGADDVHLQATTHEPQEIGV